MLRSVSSVSPSTAICSFIPRSGSRRDATNSESPSAGTPTATKAHRHPSPPMMLAIAPTETGPTSWPIGAPRP